MQRVKKLDGVRGIAIVLVLINHLGYFLAKPWIDTRAGQFFYETCNMGWLGVEVFFVLSGFLITGVLLDRRHARAYWRDFYAKRFFRIAPAFFAICLPIAIALYVRGDLTGIQAALYLSPFSNWVIIHGNPTELFPHLWSLAIEEQFYLVWPFVVRRSSPRTVCYVGLAVACTSALLHLAATAVHVPEFTIYNATPTRLFGIALGSSLAGAVRTGWIKDALARALRPLVALAIGLLVAGYVWGGFDYLWIRSSTAMVGIIATDLLTAITIFAVSQRNEPDSAGLLDSPVLRWFGSRSYSLYLVHVPLKFACISLIAMYETLPPRTVAALNLSGFAITLGLSMVISETSWRFLERPAIRLGAKLTTARETLLER